MKGGADCVHVTINGLGEKTGNADLAEMIIAAKLYGIPVIDFYINNGTKIAIASDPLTFVLSPVGGGEGRVRGM